MELEAWIAECLIKLIWRLYIKIFITKTGVSAIFEILKLGTPLYNTNLYAI